MKKMVTGVLALVMVLVMVGCGQKDNGVVNGVAKDGATIGEGAKSFTTEVVDKDGGKVTFTVKTDADTVGKALLGRKVGDRVHIQVNDNYGYDVQIRRIEKTGEDPDIPISTF